MNKGIESWLLTFSSSCGSWLARVDSHGVLSYLQNPLCHMSTILGASWMGRESSPGAKRIL